MTVGGQTFGFPAASIPSFLLYNKRVFDDAGLEPPTTWDDLIAAGQTLKDEDVAVFNLAGEDYTTCVYLAWQAGAQWWQVDGDGWKVEVDSEATAEAAEVVQQMIDEDLVEKISYAEYAAMMADYNDGAIATRQLSTWQTKGMQENLTTGNGEWAPAPNPAFEGQDPANVSFTRFWGISQDCENPEAAAYFASWAITDAEALELNADPETGASWFPATAETEAYVEVTKPEALLGDNGDQWAPVVEEAIATQKGDWTYGPNAAAAFEVLADQWGQAVAGRIQVADIAPFMQEWIVDDLEQSGITVTE